MWAPILTENKDNILAAWMDTLATSRILEEKLLKATVIPCIRIWPKSTKSEIFWIWGNRIRTYHLKTTE
ncbi:hypothetical protein [Algoriphagus hitonicola]|uniref:hypothetical protein n=1 Tax=Algoriphagus hitonicola TaxID=435880 RepID=UPI00361B221F